MKNFKTLWIVKVIFTICLLGTAFTILLCGFATYSQIYDRKSVDDVSTMDASADLNMAKDTKAFTVSDDITVRLSQKENDLYYISITITADDTLWEIAARYHTERNGSIKDYIHLIKKCNNMTSDTIYAGSHLIIPVYELQAAL